MNAYILYKKDHWDSALVPRETNVCILRQKTNNFEVVMLRLKKHFNVG